MAKKPHEEIQWANGPPPKKTVRQPIVRPKTAQSVGFIILDDQVTEVWTHWIGGRTQPCLGAGCECANWKEGQRRRWKGYVMALQKPGMALVIAEITPEAYRGNKELQDHSRSLHKAELTLRRLGDKPNGKVVATVRYEAAVKVGKSPIDVRDALWEVWFSEGEARLTQARIQRLRVEFVENNPVDPSEVTAGSDLDHTQGE